MVRVPLHMLERPVSGCRPSLLETTILTLKETNKLPHLSHKTEYTVGYYIINRKL